MYIDYGIAPTCILCIYAFYNSTVISLLSLMFIVDFYFLLYFILITSSLFFLLLSAAEDSLAPALPTCVVNIPTSDSSYDVNIEYKPPVYEEDERFIALLSSRKASGPFSSVLITPITAQNERPHLLLHVAISNGDTEMVKYLLEKEADVSSNINVVIL